MRAHGFGLVVAAALRCFAADAISWSEPVDQIRIGIGYDATTTPPNLIVVLQNVGPLRRTLVVGEQGAFSGDASGDNVKFSCTDPDGQPQQCFDLRWTAVNGVIQPVVVSLDPGASHQMLVPAQKILKIEERTAISLNVPLHDLLRRGYAIRAAFEVTNALLRHWVDRQELTTTSGYWVGTVASPELRLQ